MAFAIKRLRHNIVMLCHALVAPAAFFRRAGETSDAAKAIGELLREPLVILSG